MQTREVEIKTSLFKVKKIHNTSNQFISTKSFNYYPVLLKSPFSSKIVEESKLIIHLNSKKILCLERPFLEWLVGFTDAVRSRRLRRNISLRHFNGYNKYNSLALRTDLSNRPSY